MIRVEKLSKTFVLHNQGDVELRVLEDVDLEVEGGECVALHGASGVGKSTLLKCLYGNYRISQGSARVAGVEVASASPRELLRLRRDSVAYVSQFLRVIPRIAALEVVLDGVPLRAEAEALLERLRIPRRLWSVPPATFSGGEQQRINLARSFLQPRAVLLLDEPTASLDADNCRTVVALVNEARASGAAILGIFHDPGVRDAVATRVHELH
ncbi:MAG TPA: phosphonate C-P lyase system protein PhnL [Burkholderiales bacterium]|nr:phosphonate C-P lyase system protein PhnL [Burkholderiales bacterium]